MKKFFRKQENLKLKAKKNNSSTGSPRPYGPGLDGPSGYMLYNSPGGGTDFYRVNQTGKDDIIVVYFYYFLSLSLPMIVLCLCKKKEAKCIQQIKPFHTWQRKHILYDVHQKKLLMSLYSKNILMCVCVEDGRDKKIQCCTVCT